MAKYGMTTPGKMRRGLVSAPPVESPGASMCQGGRPRRGAVPKSIPASMHQGSKGKPGSIGPCKVPSVRASTKQ